MDRIAVMVDFSVDDKTIQALHRFEDNIQPAYQPSGISRLKKAAFLLQLDDFGLSTKCELQRTLRKPRGLSSVGVKSLSKKLNKITVHWECGLCAIHSKNHPVNCFMAKLPTGNRRLRMLRTPILLACVFFSAIVIASAEDEQGCSDHPLLTRVKGFSITECSNQNFGEEEMYYAEDKSRMVEGKRSVISYTLDDGATPVSEVQVRRNYSNAITRLGGNLIQEEKFDAYLKLEKSGNETWVRVQVFDGAAEYKLYIIEVEAMRQDVTASEMLKALNDKGFVALYINFDTDKAVVKPESQPVIDQIIALLKENSSLKVSIEGHTDNTGTAQRNKTLSEQRAQSVLNAVLKGSIEKERLSSKGWGQDKPMADNKTEEGKAKNRRVEIVKQ